MANDPAARASAPPDAAVQLGTDMTIACAATLRDTLADAVAAADGALQLDLDSVHEFDSSGVQLLLSARRSMAGRGDTLHIVAASAPVREALAMFGLASLLDTPASAT